MTSALMPLIAILSIKVDKMYCKHEKTTATDFITSHQIIIHPLVILYYDIDIYKKNTNT